MNGVSLIPKPTLRPSKLSDGTVLLGKVFCCVEVRDVIERHNRVARILSDAEERHKCLLKRLEQYLYCSR